MRSVLSAYKIDLRWNGTVNNYTNKAFANHETIGGDTLAQKFQKTINNVNFQRKTRIGGAEALNVWIVQSISSAAGTPAGTVTSPGAVSIFSRGQDFN